MFVDLRVAQLLCSRICHDLLSPAAGVNAGVELLAEGGDNGPDAVGLIGRSATQVARRLAFYRVAFGLGSSAEGVVDGFSEAGEALFLMDNFDGTIVISLLSARVLRSKTEFFRDARAKKCSFRIAKSDRSINHHREYIRNQTEDYCYGSCRHFEM